MAAADTGPPRSLVSLVSDKFNVAEKAGQVTFSATEVATIKTGNGTPLQSRYCPALAKKPKANEAKADKKPKPNPFANPSEDLLVTSIPDTPPTHNIILNKYPIIRNHFILSTIPWKSQTALLEEEDLALTHALLRKWSEPKGNGRLFAFFNSGPHSGASQPHRHIQFLPIEDMMTPETAAWRPAIDLISSTCRDAEEYTVQAGTVFPFAHYSCRLPREPQNRRLHEAYMSLYAAAVESIPPPSSDEMSVTKQAPNPPEGVISYNLAMTTEIMTICPRRSEFGELGDGEGKVGFNGTILAGTFMLKEEGIWRRVLEHPEKIERVLRSIGYPFPQQDDSTADPTSTQKL